MLTILGSRMNTKQTTLSIGYTQDKKEGDVFTKCIANSLGIKLRRSGNGIQKGRKKAK